MSSITEGNLKKLSKINYAKQVIDKVSASTLNHSVESISTTRTHSVKRKKKIGSKKRSALLGINPNRIVIENHRNVESLDAPAPQPESKKVKLTEGIQNFAQIKTNCFDIDELINEGNGLRDNEILSIYGKAGLGKTQICHIFAANCLFNDSKSKVIWISCNSNSFRPSRIKEILQSKNLPNTEISK